MNLGYKNAAAIEAEYIIHRISRERLKDMQLLHKEVVGKEVPLSFLLKKYDTAYTGVEYIGHIVYHRVTGEIAAYTALIPVVFQFKGQKIIGGHSADSATSNNHQKKGLFGYLLHITEDLARAEGVQFFWGFANQNSLGPVLRAFGQINVENMKCYQFLIPALPIEPIIRRLPVLQRIYQGYTNLVLRCFFRPADRLPDTAAQNNNCGTLRDAAYMQYKKLDHSSVWKHKNAIVWLKVRGGIQIGDIEMEDYTQLNHLIRRLKWVAFFVGTRKMFFHFSPRLSINTVMETLCPAIGSWHICVRDYTTGLPLEELNYTYGDQDNF